MNYRKSYHQRTVSPDGKVVTESTGYVEISAEDNIDSSGRVSSTRVTSHSSSSSSVTSSASSSRHDSDWQRVDG